MDNLSKSSMNFLTSSGLDRMPSVRIRSTPMKELLRSGSARFLPIKGDKNLLRKGNAVEPVILKYGDFPEAAPDGNCCFLLGSREDLIYFAVDLDAAPITFEPPEGTEFTGLRKSLLDVKNWMGALLAYGNALVAWHRNHRFCGICGHRTETAEMGQARYCSNRDCAAPHYPRTDPAIIVVVTRGDKCLLARKEGWPEGMYSVVAGYVDHGESLEDTVVREVFEETGVRVKSVTYHSSQPWPFPYTLMLGYFAEAETEEITVDRHELEEARWMTREDIIGGLKKGTQKLPSPFSISRKLITDWFNSGDRGKLEDYI